MLLKEVLAPMRNYTILWRVEGTFYKGDAVASSEKAAISRMAQRIAQRVFGGSRALANSKFTTCIKGAPIVNPDRTSPEWNRAVAV